MENQHPSRSGTGQQPVRDWTKPERGDITDRGQARNYGSEAQEYVQGAVQQTREYVEDTVQQARDKMTEYREGGVERVKQDIVHYTRQGPMMALLIAAAAGILLGWLAAVGRR
jgi:ElaB/YqjD/DUF883 family membrane-anchored ribosome-binding protein